MMNLSPEFLGEWKVEIVNKKNNNTYYPFGNCFYKNLLLDVGIVELLHANYHREHEVDISSGRSLYNFQTIPVFLKGGAAIGSGTSIPKINDTGLESIKQTSTRLLSSHREHHCKTIDNLEKGSRSYIRVFDFDTFNMDTVINEAGLYSDILGGKYYSRFLFPEEIYLTVDEYIRLIYRFTVRIKAISTPILVSGHLNNGFNPDGEIKLVGRFDDIFGAMNSLGDPIITRGDSALSCTVPFCERFPINNLELDTWVEPTAYWVHGDIDFPAANASLVIETAGRRLLSDSWQNENEVILSAFNENNLYRDCTYIFNKDNPGSSGGDMVGGILFTNMIMSSSIAKVRENTWAGWYLKFNVPQLKSAMNKITITIRSSIPRRYF